MRTFKKHRKSPFVILKQSNFTFIDSIELHRLGIKRRTFPIQSIRHSTREHQRTGHLFLVCVLSLPVCQEQSELGRAGGRSRVNSTNYGVRAIFPLKSSTGKFLTKTERKGTFRKIFLIFSKKRQLLKNLLTPHKNFTLELKAHQNGVQSGAPSKTLERGAECTPENSYAPERGAEQTLPWAQGLFRGRHAHSILR